MRMSDGSSDVCSSDLGAADLPEATKKILAELKVDASVLDGIDKELAVPQEWIEAAKKEGELRIVDTHSDKDHARMTAPFRSEEHTSELQSLMRISYAVFCLKKKHIIQPNQTTD